ncbi:hypothetical protein GJ744_007598 [Endocarpon pusillum]|uniref:Uncharacterized protein n=1 Tax=Endocarpon pusillum TaxID=364733 RepID=A0A8H7E559_9EURO|nr:hypothetical protein GJ744_007598 [Endocarpon pusillum]
MVTAGNLRKPWIIAIKTRTANEQDTPRHHMCDMMVIGCRRSCANMQWVWMDLLEEAVERLDRYSSKQSTFLIATIGSSYMSFFWDHTAISAAALTIGFSVGSYRHTLTLGYSRWVWLRGFRTCRAQLGARWGLRPSENSITEAF